jgi:hypothetical protein
MWPGPGSKEQQPNRMSEWKVDRSDCAGQQGLGLPEEPRSQLRGQSRLLPHADLTMCSGPMHGLGL